MKSIFLLVGLFAFTALPVPSSLAAPVSAGPQAPEVPSQVHYKTGKDVSFEEILIHGEIKRPEISVVTGDTQQGTDGLLRLRENFLDRMAADFGEKSE